MSAPALVIAQTIDRPAHVVATFHGGYALDNAKRFAADHARVCGGEAWVWAALTEGMSVLGRSIIYDGELYRRLDGYTATERLAVRG